MHKRQNNENVENNAPKLIFSDRHGSRIESGFKNNPNRYGRMIRKPDKLNF